ncbi:DNA repair and recombination protein RAD54B-like isoform X1 [Scylla paramamosain]|uniref:DNA repair and recombination protein RAD54B-like isoform X1 n=1 Tax=Scylla paramamosain TaxID=85552 RepID=UPI003082EC74
MLAVRKVQAKVSMRRSAAPSQLLKRTQQYRLPFASPAAKRPCPTPQEDVPQKAEPQKQEQPSAVKVRSASDILSVISKSSTLEENGTKNENENFSSSEFGGQSNSFTQDVDLSPLTETNCNVSHHSNVAGTKNSLGNVRSFNAPGRQLAGAQRGWNRPQLSGRPPNTIRSLPGEENQAPSETKYYAVVWCKLSRKKHKNWEGDAILIVKGRSVTLKDLEGKEIGRGSGYKLKDLGSLEEGSTLPVGGKEVEIQNVISAESYALGHCFQGEVTVTEKAESSSRLPRPKPKPFRLPTLGRPAGPACSSTEAENMPLFNPALPDALVMPRPPAQHQWHHNSGRTSVVDVVVDPHLASQLRPHQQEGVVFLYECMMGFHLQTGCGAILADEMGLGKTLQCITLIWTLLKQGPYGRRPVVRRVLVVTPSSLTSNWRKEFKKWLGKERLGVFVVDQQNKVEQYTSQQHTPVMIISYEMFLRNSEVIEKIGFDLIICDEAHRLKNPAIKTTHLLASLPCKRRILVTGTPIQNDLQELFALVDFANPGVLGTPSSFRHIYEEPIVASQQPNTPLTEKELGASRASQLNRITSLFILRRTQDIINRYLPPKAEYVVLCQPSETQQALYSEVVGCRSLRRCFTSLEPGDHLSAILALRKLCNHPALLAVSEESDNKNELSKEISTFMPSHLQAGVYDEADSGKLAVVSCMLWALREVGQEKIVLVSNYTTTLDMLASLCVRYNYPYLRLDGSTPSAKRQKLVDSFNSKCSTDFVFLLSAKAGGVGLNLVGASRILLYDIDWNPATDLQAMARVWRDGQHRKVHIYRLLVTGTLDEKMYQRQVRKQGLSGAVVDARDSERVHFSTEELKDLFTVHWDTACLTHDLLECECDQQGGSGAPPQKTAQEPERACQLGGAGNITIDAAQPTKTMDQLQNWYHLAPPLSSTLIKDHCLEAASDFITFLFYNESRTEVVKQ